jgi:hypothetical protein
MADGGGRSLRPGEIALLQSIYDSNLAGVKPNSVTVFSEKYHRMPTQFGNIVTPNGNIYLGGYPAPDFSKLDFFGQSLLVHEFEHIIQYNQTGQSLFGQGLMSLLQNFGYYQNTYHYNLGEVKNFDDLNIEQQAVPIQDYFLTLKEEAPRPPVCSFAIRHGLVRKTDRGLSAPPSLLDRLQADTGAMRLPRSF